MPNRVRIVSGDGEWTAEVQGGEVALADGERHLGVWTVRATDASAERFDAVGPDGATATGVAVVAGDAVWIQIAGEVIELRTSRGRRGSAERESEILSAPMPATVTRIAVAVGDAVRRGDLLIALEAMKMELPIHAPRDGVVRAIHCQEGDLVQPGDGLIDL